MVYAESGGVTKTTTAVSLAMCAAEAGRATVLIDLDPRGAASHWLGIEPRQSGYHSGAIIGNDDAADWIDGLIVATSWSDQLRAIPSARTLSTREEGDNAQGSELRLRRALAAVQADLIVLDMPNRQGGPITRNGLNAADKVIYAANPTPDGVEGVDGARTTVEKFRAGRREIGAPEGVVEGGIVIGAYPEVVPSRVHKMGVAALEETGLLLRPIVPHRAIVQESRATGTWYGSYEKGRPVMSAYQEILGQVAA